MLDLSRKFILSPVLPNWTAFDIPCDPEFLHMEKDPFGSVCYWPERFRWSI